MAAHFFFQDLLSPSRRCSIVYIDGFNFYYGAIKNTSHKWLDLQRYFDRLRVDDDVVVVHYFTSLVDGPGRVRQTEFLSALSTLPRVRVHLGKFKRKTIKCRHPLCTYPGDRHFEGIEEKRTDVSIAVQMLDDAHHVPCDCLVVVSGDSDLVPAVQAVRLRHPQKQVIVYVPGRGVHPGRQSSELAGVATRARDLPMALLQHCHLPDEVVDSAGRRFKKPSTW